MKADPPPRPVEIRYDSATHRLTVRFAEGQTFALAAELLRAHSPSAEVRGHRAQDRKLVTGCRDVGITAMEQVGHYGLRITFDDGHDTGIFDWAYLFDLGLNQDIYMASYVADLERAGLSRDR
jgi:DUF971 family protein